MGHAIDFITVNSRNEIFLAANDFAEVNVDRLEDPFGSYHGNMTIHDDIICDTLESAKAKINQLERGSYDDHAVRYYDTSHLVPSKKLEKIKEQILENNRKKNEYVKKNRIAYRKSAFVGCDKCGSKIAMRAFRKEYANGIIEPIRDICPICHNDLRSETVQNRLKNFQEKNDELLAKKEEIKKEFNQKNAKKGKLKWLVKVEVHC